MSCEGRYLFHSAAVVALPGATGDTHLRDRPLAPAARACTLRGHLVTSGSADKDHCGQGCIMVIMCSENMPSGWITTASNVMPLCKAQDIGRVHASCSLHPA